MNIKNKRKPLSITWILCVCITILYALSLTFLFIEQSLNWTKYGSDLLTHIQFGLSGKSSYSLMYILLSFLWQFPHHSFLVAIFLTALSLLSIYLTFILLKYLLPQVKKENLYALSLICNMYMPLYIPYFNDYPYLGLLSFNLFHNPTYIAMKPLSILSIILFVRLMDKYHIKSISFSEWVCFSFSLFITTWFKPNFMFGFAPCMLIIMIVDFFRGKGKKILNYIVFGTTVFPSLLLMLWQRTQLFDDSNGLGFGFLKVLRLFSKNPCMSLMLSMAFPLTVLLFNYKSLIKDKIYRFSWLFTLVNLSIFAFIHENGVRQADGNLVWGAQLAVGILFTISICKFINTIYSKNIRYIIIVSSVLGMHVFCWINYYIRYLESGVYL